LYALRRDRLFDLVVPADAPFAHLPSVVVRLPDARAGAPPPPSPCATCTAAGRPPAACTCSFDALNAALASWTRSLVIPAPASAASHPPLAPGDLVRAYLVAPRDHLYALPPTSATALDPAAPHDAVPAFLGLARVERTRDGGATVTVAKVVTLVDGDFEFRPRRPFTPRTDDAATDAMEGAAPPHNRGGGGNRRRAPRPITNDPPAWAVIPPPRPAPSPTQ